MTTRWLVMTAALATALAGVSYTVKCSNETQSPAPSKPSSTAGGDNGPPPAPPAVRLAFRDIATKAGLTVSRYDGADGRFRLVETMGSGVGLFDFDGDGWLDLFLGQGAMIPADPSDGHASQLYRNNRDGTFTDVAEAAGVAFKGFAQGVAMGDVNRDGDEDLYVSGFNSAALYRNNGDGTFTDVTGPAGLVGKGWSTSAAFADLDGDGDLDLYVTRYLADTVGPNGDPTVNCNALPGRIGYCPPFAFSPTPDALYRNNGDGTFNDVSRESGVTVEGNGLGLAIADFDDDGWLDIFVANDKTPHLLYRNLGALKFKEVGLPWGVALNESGAATAGMGVAAGDHDGDGRTDILVTNFYEEGLTLYRNIGPERFQVATASAGLRLPTRSKLGFGTGFLDADNDGWLDLFVANGHVNDVRPLGMPYQMTPQLFRNDGGGRYSDASLGAGDYFQRLWLGRGTAFGDLDNDGLTDIVVTHNSGPPTVLRNVTEGAGHALRLTLAAAVPSNENIRDRRPIGARVMVETSGRTVIREVVGGTSYLSQNDPRISVGLGPANRADRVVVRWPSGRVEIWEGVPADEPIELVEGEGTGSSQGPLR